MAENLMTLRKRAKAAGMTGTRGADRDELQAFLDGAGGKKSPVKKKRSKRAPVQKRTRTKRPAFERKAPARRGRPPGSKNKAKPGRKPAATPKPAQRRDNSSGRNQIDERALDFSADGFNTRAGGDRELIFKALKKARGNRGRAFDALLPQLSRLVPSKKGNGERRTKAEKEAFLRYLINRVLFDFAVATGQHQASKNRAEYGTAGTGAGTFKRGKPARKPAARKPAARKPAKRGPGRPPGKRGPGRPPGSKNKRRRVKR